MLFNKIEKRSKMTYNDMKNFTWTTVSGFPLSKKDYIKCSTYFSCLKILSESIAKCHLEIKQDTDKGEVVAKEHYLYELLRLRPNESMSTVDLLKTLVLLYKHEGIAGILIDRDYKGNVRALYPARVLEIIIDNLGLVKSNKNNKVAIKYKVCGKEGYCFEKDMVLLKDFTLDGVNTLATKDILDSTYATSVKSEEYLNSLFDSGLTNKLAISTTSDIQDRSKLEDIRTTFDYLLGSDKNERIFPIPAGFDVKPLNLSLSDAQFEQLKKMSVKEIASSLGVPMSKLGDLSDTNNNSLEQSNISFLVDTLQIIFESIEQESDYKILNKTLREEGYKIRFNVGVMLKCSPKEQSEIVSRYMDKGIYTINDSRRLLGYTDIEGGDIPMVTSGYMPLDITREYYSKDLKGGDKNE